MQRHWDTEWTMTFLSLITPSPYSLLITLLMALFPEQVLYLNYFRKLVERSIFFLSLLELDFFNIEMDPCATDIFWGWQILLL